MKVRSAITFLALGAALLLPAACFSQGMGSMGTGAKSAMPTGGMVAPAEVLRSLLAGEGHEFMALAGAMPQDKFNFAPDDKMGKFDGVRTWAEEIKHVTEVNYGVFHGWSIPGAMSREDIEKLQSPVEILSALRASYAYIQREIDTITPQNALEDMDGKGTTRFGTVAYVLIHDNDHLGQMVEYLRMNGMIPPESQPKAK